MYKGNFNQIITIYCKPMSDEKYDKFLEDINSPDFKRRVAHTVIPFYKSITKLNKITIKEYWHYRRNEAVTFNIRVELFDVPYESQMLPYGDDDSTYIEDVTPGVEFPNIDYCKYESGDLFVMSLGEMLPNLTIDHIEAKGFSLDNGY